MSQTNTAVKQIKTNVNTVIATPRRVRSHGARLITSNRADFEMISRYRGLQLEIW